MSSNQENIEVLIGKFFNGELTIEELKILDNWRKKEQTNESLFQEYFKSYTLVDDVLVRSHINLDKEWKKQQILMDIKSDKKRNLLAPLLKIAASIVLVVLSALIVYYVVGSGEKVITNNQIADITLPDGSEVFVNVDSKIKYKKEFNNEERRVKLAGEAFFEVERDTNKPFIVETKNVLVEVLGTSFNVEENELEKFTEVLVSEGIVKVVSRKSSDKEVILNKGESARWYYNSSKLTKLKEIDENSIAWKTGVLKFKNKKLSYIVKKLNKTFHTHIVIENPEIADCRMTTVFEHQDLKSVLTVLQATLDLQIRQSGDKIILSGYGCE